MLTTVKRTISLEGFKGLSHLEINKTLIEWHDANILLNETLGSLECERDRVQRGRVKSSVPQKSGKQKAKELMQNSTLKMIANLVVLGIIAGVFYMYWPDIVKSPFYQTYLAGWGGHGDWIIQYASNSNSCTEITTLYCLKQTGALYAPLFHYEKHLLRLQWLPVFARIVKKNYEFKKIQ